MIEKMFLHFLNGVFVSNEKVDTVSTWGGGIVPLNPYFTKGKNNIIKIRVCKV